MPDRTVEAVGHWAPALAIARSLADAGRLAPIGAYFIGSLEQRLAAAPAGSTPPH